MLLETVSDDIKVLVIDNLKPAGCERLLQGYGSRYPSDHAAVQVLGGHAGHLSALAKGTSFRALYNGELKKFRRETKTETKKGKKYIKAVMVRAGSVEVHE